MKKFFKGFTISELLFAVLIIGIISALGANIAKRPIQNAYNKYYTYGYLNLFDAVAEAHDKGQDGRRADLEQELSSIFGTTVDNDHNIVTRNGIRYHIESDNNGAGGPYIISMTVPQPKTRQNNGIGTMYLYWNPQGIGHLIPLNDENGIRFQERQDLLPFYINDGNMFDNNNNFIRVVPMSYQDAACSVYGGLEIEMPNNIAGLHLKQSKLGEDALWEKDSAVGNWGFNNEQTQKMVVVDCSDFAGNVNVNVNDKRTVLPYTGKLKN